MNEKISELVWWSVKWVIVAVILIASIQVYSRLNRHNLLVDAVLSNLRQAEQASLFELEMKKKAVQELPGPDDPVPTEDLKLRQQ